MSVLGVAVTPSLFNDDDAPTGMVRDAVLSPCGTYRFRLTRIWDPSRPGAVFVMLNPSTGDDKEDDPTIRRCIGFAQSWGCGRLDIVNLFAYRSPYPEKLWKAWDDGVDIIGDWHEHHEAAINDAGRGKKVVAAWGNRISGRPLGKSRALMMLFRVLQPATSTVYCLGLTNDGRPKHPLYLPADTPLVPYPGEDLKDEG